MLTESVTQCDAEQVAGLDTLLARYQLKVSLVANNSPIDGSYWGEPEAGLIEDRLIIRADTPVHSALHEACHYVCMDQQRRGNLHTDAAGGYDEEDAVCYLQVLLSDKLPAYSRKRMFADMDAWGYSFRLGSSSAWFNQDAEDARAWLLNHHLINHEQQPTWLLRQ